MRWRSPWVWGTLAMLMGSNAAWAESAAVFPQKFVRIVVTTPAGGPSDAAARVLAQHLTAVWKQQVIVENKPGANGAIAAQSVINAPADGYTLLWAQSSLAGLPYAQVNAPYKRMLEFSPVSGVLNFGYAVFVNRDLPVQSMADLVKLSKKAGDSLTYATGTLGEYMAATQVLESTGMTALRVPYKGGAQLMPDLISGLVAMNVGPISSGVSHVRQGRLKALMCLLPQRSPLMPEVPTAKELGLKASSFPSWNAVFAPPKTPQDIVSKLSKDISDALRHPKTITSYEQQGAVPWGSTPEQLAIEVDRTEQVWKAFIQQHDISKD